MKNALVEVGPVAIRRISPQPEVCADSTLATIALQGIDDTTVLVDERPVDVMAVWRNVMSSVIDSHVAVIVVYPSWWPQRRVHRIIEATRQIIDNTSTTLTYNNTAYSQGSYNVNNVVALPRSQIISPQVLSHPKLIIEIAEEYIGITADENIIAVISRGSNSSTITTSVIDAVSDSVAAAVTDVSGAHNNIECLTEVLIDAPKTVVGAEDIAKAIQIALMNRYVMTRRAWVDESCQSVLSALNQPQTYHHQDIRRRRRRRRRRRWWWWNALYVIGIVTAAIMIWIGVLSYRTGRQEISTVTADTTMMVEGHIAVQIPAHWKVIRMMSTSGSRRVEVSAPHDPKTAMYITQSVVGPSTMEETAQIFQQLLAHEPAGVFTDFDSASSYGGRPVVTYREVRSGRSIQWIIMIDGPIRIGIGCQNASHQDDGPDADNTDTRITDAGAIAGSETIAEVCAQAVRSAHHIGTDSES